MFFISPQSKGFEDISINESLDFDIRRDSDSKLIRLRFGRVRRVHSYRDECTSLGLVGGPFYPSSLDDKLSRSSRDEKHRPIEGSRTELSLLLLDVIPVVSLRPCDFSRWCHERDSSDSPVRVVLMGYSHSRDKSVLQDGISEEYDLRII